MAIVHAYVLSQHSRGEVADMSVTSPKQGYACIRTDAAGQGWGVLKFCHCAVLDAIPCGSGT